MNNRWIAVTGSFTKKANRVLFIMNKYGCLFDKQIINISHKRLDGYIEEREDGVYMLSNGKWICLDKKR